MQGGDETLKTTSISSTRGTTKRLFYQKSKSAFINKYHKYVEGNTQCGWKAISV